jgi:redox-sensitive bicupin YhaK (pirin superfamily)
MTAHINVLVGRHTNMLQHKPFSEIAGADIGWLKAKHHFAIGIYGNPRHRPVGNLFVLNDDEIAGRSGFPLHSHANVEIVTYVREGVVTHEDSLGNKGHIRAGDVQVMSAGTGVSHAEYNESDTATRLFQMWIHPRKRGGEPHWRTRAFPKADRAGRFVPLVSGYGAEGALPIRSNFELYGIVLPKHAATIFEFPPGHSGYLVPATGPVVVNGQRVDLREGLVIRDEASIAIAAQADSELVLIVTA